MEVSRIKYVAGLFLTLVNNALIVISRYIVRDAKLSPADLLLFKGSVQIPLFGLLAYIKCRRQRNKVDISKDDSGGGKPRGPQEYSIFPSSRKDQVACLLLFILGPLPFASLYAAVKFTPMTDIVAVAALVPILTYIISWLWLKKKITWLRVVCCISVIAGVSLVVQPPFLFGDISGTCMKSKEKSAWFVDMAA